MPGEVWETYPRWMGKTDFDKELIIEVAEVLAEHITDKSLCIYLANLVIEDLTTMYNVEP